MDRRCSTTRDTSSSLPSFGGLRRFSRRELEIGVVLQDGDGWEVPVESVDISPTGMFVRSDFLFEEGTEHTLIFRAPDGAFLFRLRARIVRVEEDERPTGMAYEFIGVDAETERQLRSLVDTPDEAAASSETSTARR